MHYLGPSFPMGPLQSPPQTTAPWKHADLGCTQESACNAGDTGYTGLILGSKRSSGEGNGDPLQYSCLENPLDRGAWWLRFMASQRVGNNWVTKHSTSLPFFMALDVNTKMRPPDSWADGSEKSVALLMQSWTGPPLALVQVEYIGVSNSPRCEMFSWRIFLSLEGGGLCLVPVLLWKDS